MALRWRNNCCAVGAGALPQLLPPLPERAAVRPTFAKMLLRSQPAQWRASSRHNSAWRGVERMASNKKYAPGRTYKGIQVVGSTLVLHNALVTLGKLLCL